MEYQKEKKEKLREELRELQEKVKELKAEIAELNDLKRPITVKISRIEEDYIEFNDGRKITFRNDEMWARNYAAFSALKDCGVQHVKFNTKDKDIQFEKAANHGFRFGDGIMMFFVPCYSEQNGYYSCDLDILFDGQVVLTAEGECSY